METIALRLDPDTRHKLELLAEATGYSRSTLVHEAVRRFVETELAFVLTLRENAAGPALAPGGQNEKTPETEEAPLPERWKIIV